MHIMMSVLRAAVPRPCLPRSGLRQPASNMIRARKHSPDSKDIKANRNGVSLARIHQAWVGLASRSKCNKRERAPLCKALL